jgi:putative ABC transport system permease protein
LLQDILFGFRILRRSPGFTVVAAFTLALGIGANTAVFSVVNAVIMRPLRFHDSGRLMVLLSTSLNTGKSFHSAQGVFVDWRERATSFESVEGARSTQKILSGRDQPHSVSIVETSSGFFRMLGARPLLGRPFTQQEDQPGQGAVALVAAGFWQREFGGDPNILGRAIILDDKQYRVIGILPELPFGYYTTTDIWTPMGANRMFRSGGDVVGVGRLRPGVTRAAAQAEMNTIMGQIRSEHQEDSKTGVLVEPLQDWVVGDIRASFLMLLGAVGFVLLICCANIANLVLARSMARRKEMAIRAALGAGRWRLLRQSVVESVLLASIGGALGIALAFAAVRAVPAIRAIRIPRLEEIAVDRTVLIVAALTTLASGVLFGLAPVFQIGRRDLGLALHRGQGLGVEGRGGLGIRNVLVVAQMALALVLLSGAGLMTNSLLRLLNVDLGFERGHVLTIATNLPYKKYDAAREVAFQRRLAAEVRRMPGVTDASATDYPPLQAVLFPYQLRTEGGGAARNLEALARHVDSSYRNVMRIPLLAGRDFEPADDTRSPIPALIGKTAARLLFGAEDPVGKRLLTNYRSRAILEVIGVVGDAHQLGVAAEPGAQLYLPLVYGIPSYVVARTVSGSGDLSGAIRAAVRVLDPEVPAPRVTSMDASFSGQVATPRFYTLLLGAFAAVGLILAAIGIYGVMSYTVARRTHEFGIRMALGAKPGDILRLVLGAGTRLTCVGAMVGLAGAFAATRLLSALLYGVQPSDPVTLVCVLMLLIGVALLACYLAARRATRVDPIVALRSE